MKKTKALSLLLLFLFLASCSNDGTNDNNDAINNFTSQICNNVNGATAVYWDYAHGLPTPLTQIPVLADIGGNYIHSQYPPLSFPLPQGYSGFDAPTDPLSATIGVNVIRNDNAVVWRYVPSTRFIGVGNINDIMASEINQMFGFYGFNGNFEVLCAENQTGNQDGIIIMFSSRLIRFGNTTALVWVRAHYFESINTFYVSTSISAGPTAEYNNLVMNIFFPLSFQLLVIDNNVRDSDLDGFPDNQDAFPFDPTRH